MRPEELKENLQLIFDSFIDRTEQLLFFQGLAEYLALVEDTSELSAVLEQEIVKRNERYTKVAELEEIAEKEVQQSKQRLLDIIEKNGIDVSTFWHLSIFRMPPWMNDVVGQLKAYENGEIIHSKFKSDGLGSYLFEIAANLKERGFEKELGDLLVTPDEHNVYYRRINGEEASAGYFITNENGNFIFSKTLPERYEEERLIKQERRVGTWGAPEKLLRFKCAFDEVTKNKGIGSILEDKGDKKDWFVVDDVIEIGCMVMDIDLMLGKSLPSIAQWRADRASTIDEAMSVLHRTPFKAAVESVHNRLMRTTLNAFSAHDSPEKSLRSIHLVTKSLSEPDPIFIVLDEHYEAPIRVSPSTNKSVKMLYNLAYFINAPDKAVDYNKRNSDAINNDFFAIARIREYMNTNGLAKPKLAKKKDNLLVLENKVPVKTLILNQVPSQHKHQYIDKTK